MDPSTAQATVEMNNKQNLALITEDVFRQAYRYHEKKGKSVGVRIKQELSFSKQTIFNFLPILSWLPAHRWKESITGDVIAGLTVSVMHIPHGLAYAQLGGVDPVVGLYMAVFPTIIYIFMGTSRHISLGTFAVLCMMAGKTVNEHAPFLKEMAQIPSNTTQPTVPFTTEDSLLPEDMKRTGYEPLQVAITVSFTVGLWQLVLGVLRLGVLSVLLSNSLVSGFTTGAAVHVVSYQFKNLLGVSVKTFSGPLKLIYTYVDLFKNIQNTHLITLGLAISSLIVLFTFNEYLKPKIQKKWTRVKVPFPIELTVIIVGILVSYFMELDAQGVKIVANVPTGLPEPQLPSFELIPVLLVDGFVMAIVATSISLSLADIFARKSKYVLSGNQELLAYGCANIFGSFFQCLPVAASLSRSLVQHSVGGKSLLANVVNIIIILFILLFMGPLFEPVPYCVLSSIVVATLKGLLMQVTDLPRLYRQSSLDGVVWLVTFLSVVLIDLDYGLLLGILASVVTMLMRGHKPTITSLGRVPNTNLFLDLVRFQAAVPVPGISILHVSGALHFANSEHLQAAMVKRTKDEAALVLSLAGVPYMDPTAVGTLGTVYKDLQVEGCQLYLAEVPVPVFDTLQHCGFFQHFPRQHVIASVYDAVEFLSQDALAGAS